MTIFDRKQFDLFGGNLRLERKAPVPSGAVFQFGGRPLKVVKAYGDDLAAPVVVEELTSVHTLKGQYGLWSADGVSRAMRKGIK